jgi:cellulose/xylan binding protein with CBM9 domain
MRRLTVLVLGLLIAASTAPAGAVSARPQLGIPHVAKGPAIDGTLSDEAWKSAKQLALAWDLRHKSAPRQKTDVYVLSDDQALYVAFDVEQTGEIVANQHTDDVGFDTDDEVQVDLWPGGPLGFQYLFTATPLGTHYQHSSENSTYAPKWQSVGKLRPGGYTVTMRIPFNVLRGDGRANWPIQFVRFVQKTDDLLVWAYEEGQSNHNDVVYAGVLSGLSSGAMSARPKPRVGLFGIAESAARHDDGNTTRSGADVSIPLTRTASFVGTFHPDFSNVEQDQQSISPTVYRRFINEVRPFFAQMQLTNPFDCEVCPGVNELYTPGIPTPKRGYALEGSQGPVTFNAFNAIGDRRTDNAYTAQWRNEQRTIGLGFQAVDTFAPGFADRLTTVGFFANDRKHKVFYLNYGWERGTNVLDNAQAQRLDVGAAYYGNDYYFGGGIRKIGGYYNPVAGFISTPDNAGWSFDGDRTFRFKPGGWLKSVEVNGFIERYHGADGRLDRTSNDLAVTLVDKNLFRVQADTGSTYLRLSDGRLTPVSLAGIALSYRGGTATPTAFVFNQGRYGDGRIATFDRNTVIKLGPITQLALQAFDTVWYADAGYRNLQWLERIALTRNISRETSFAIGLRRIIGTPPAVANYFSFGSAPFPTGPASFYSASNVSVAYATHRKRDELYLVYGDAGAPSTKPAFIVKYVYYLGGEKGT